MNEDIIKEENTAGNSAEKAAGTDAPAAAAEVCRAETDRKKNAFSTGNRDFVFAALFIIGTFFGISWGVWKDLHLGFSIAHIFAFAVGTVYFARRGEKPGIYAAVCGILSLGLTVPFAVTSDTGVRLLSALMAVVLEWIWFAALAGKASPAGDLGLPALLSGAFFRGIGDMPAAIKALAVSEKSENKNAVKAVTGLLCALPVLVIVLPLLVESDAAFEGLVSQAVPDIGELAAQLILTLIAAPFIIGFAVSLKYREKTAFDVKERKGFNTVSVAAFSAAISLCYLAYLFSQLAYFFSAFSGILPEGYEFSYAEYARRGFFELCWIAGINLVLIFFIITFSRKKDGKLPVPLKISGVFIGIFTLAVIAAALSKMIMYINNYGMTVDRICTSAFMLFMAAVFIAALIRCFTEKVNILRFAAAAAGAVLIALGIINPKALAAKYNYEAYESGKLEAVDCHYLCDLGEEGAPYLAKLIDDEKYGAQAKVLLRETAMQLYYYESEPEKDEEESDDYFTFITAFGEKIYPGFLDTGVSRRRAYAVIDEVLKENGHIAERADIIKYYIDDLNAAGDERYIPPEITRDAIT